MVKYSKIYSQASIQKARKLRQETTKAERKLWSLIRRNQLGVHFRRQVPIGPYIVDFVSTKAKLIVELDGSQHLSEKGRVRDNNRSSYLRKQGYLVLRFDNIEFLKNSEGVIKTIIKSLRKGATGTGVQTPPYPSPTGRGNETYPIGRE